MDERPLSALGEDALVARLVRGLARGRRVIAGPGDDCAVVRTPGRRDWQLLKTDCLVEDVHFRRAHDPRRVGWKALARAISDIAASGGKPDAALVTVAAPADLPIGWLEEFYAGLNRVARKFGVSIVGGETARSPAGVFVSIALTGWTKPGRYAGRAGGRAGDVLFVTGRLGGSFGRDGSGGDGRHLRFTPRVEESRWLTRHFSVHAMMDLSDGLGADLPRLADASRVGFAVDLARIPRAPGCSVGQAIGDGEDYELLFAVAADDAGRLESRWAKRFPRVPVSRIGVLLAERRRRTALAPGYGHFAAESGADAGPGF